MLAAAFFVHGAERDMAAKAALPLLDIPFPGICHTQYDKCNNKREKTVTIDRCFSQE